MADDPNAYEFEEEAQVAREPRFGGQAMQI